MDFDRKDYRFSDGFCYEGEGVVRERALEDSKVSGQRQSYLS